MQFRIPPSKLWFHIIGLFKNAYKFCVHLPQNTSITPWVNFINIWTKTRLIDFSWTIFAEIKVKNIQTNGTIWRWKLLRWSSLSMWVWSHRLVTWFPTKLLIYFQRACLLCILHFCHLIGELVQYSTQFWTKTHLVGQQWSKLPKENLTQEIFWNTPNGYQLIQILVFHNLASNYRSREANCLPKSSKHRKLWKNLKPKVFHRAK